MKKYLSLMAFAMVAVFSLTFISCGNDDDDEPSSDYDQIEINGTKYDVFTTSLVWTDLVSIYGEDMMRGLYGDDYLDENKAIFVIAHLNGDCYTFDYTCPYEPKKGDVISNMKNFVMEPDITGQAKDIEYSYVSGTAKITDTNVSKELITIQFNNLKFKHGDKTYTFNGTLQFPYDFSELHSK